MGNENSTRWGSHTKKTTVEMCVRLDIALWKEKGLLRSQVHEYGVIEWARGSLGFEINTLDTTRWIKFSYTMPGTQEDISYRIYLHTSRRGHYFFFCPLSFGSSSDGRSCGKHARILYLPPGARYLGCRRCYRLTYISSQTSHVNEKFDRRFIQILMIDLPNLPPVYIKRFYKSFFKKTVPFKPQLTVY